MLRETWYKTGSCIAILPLSRCVQRCIKKNKNSTYVYRITMNDTPFCSEKHVE